MKDIYELYKDSLKGEKRHKLSSYDYRIQEIAAFFAQEEWFLIDNGYGGIEYHDGIDICRLPFIKNIGFYPTRKDKDNVTFGELKALGFYIRNKKLVEELSILLISKAKMITASASGSLVGPENDYAKLLFTKQTEKTVQKVK